MDLYDLGAGGTLYAQAWNGSLLLNSLQITTRPTMVYGFDGRNTDTTNAVWIMLYDSASAPANASNPLVIVAVPPTSATPANVAAGNFGYGVSSGYGRRFNNGLWIGVSTTDVTLTLSASGKTIWGVDYALVAPIR